MRNGIIGLESQYTELSTGAGQLNEVTASMNSELHEAKLDLKTKEELIAHLKEEQEMRLNESK
jgi:hypothetical protein